VTSIESNHKQIESARKGQEICVKIDPIPGESPKMFGRHFEADDMLISKVSQSTDTQEPSHLRFLTGQIKDATINSLVFGSGRINLELEIDLSALLTGS